MKKEKLIYFSFVFIFILLIFYSVYSKTFEYILDSSFFIFLITFLFIFYKNFNLNKIIFLLIFIALLLHNLGVFGFYNISPFNFQYDNLTHFFGGFALVIFFLNYFNKFTNKGFNKTFLIFIALLSALGIGSLIELTEYFGYLYLGEGEGVFYFGGTGDLNDNNLASAWINSSVDILFNLIGGLIGIVLYLFSRNYLSNVLLFI